MSLSADPLSRVGRASGGGVGGGAVEGPLAVSEAVHYLAFITAAVHPRVCTLASDVAVCKLALCVCVCVCVCV